MAVFIFYRNIQGKSYFLLCSIVEYTDLICSKICFPHIFVSIEKRKINSNEILASENHDGPLSIYRFFLFNSFIIRFFPI